MRHNVYTMGKALEIFNNQLGENCWALSCIL